MARWALILSLIFGVGPALSGCEIIYTIFHDIHYAELRKEWNRPYVLIEEYTETIQSGGLSNEELAIIYNERGSAYTATNQIDEAIRDFDEALRLNPRLVAAWINRGDAYIHKENYDQTIHNYDEALRLDPENADTWYDRGRVYAYKRNYDSAIRDLDEALRLNPGLGAAWIFRGHVYASKQQYDQAIRSYDEGLRLDPQDADAWADRGHAYAGRGDYDQAILDFSEALRVNPGKIPARHDRAEAYYQNGQYDLAIRDIDHLLYSGVSWASLWRDRGDAYMRLGQFDQALDSYNRAHSLDRGNADTLSRQASVYVNRQQYEQAIRNLDVALRIDPHHGTARHGRGRANFYLAQYAEAAADFARVVETAPEDRFAVIWLYLAETRGGRDGRLTLERHAELLDLEDWPGMVVRLYLGDTNPGEFMAAAKSSNPKHQAEKLCEAFFYLGQHALLDGHIDQARQLFNAAIDTGVTFSIGYVGAKAELARLE
ncbi:MAG: tetratricopeptide repeat protein [Alphaproteobacteria bacterium]|jgi:tetratricopeptide (TPR) repeat protein|nr:tetratricopeptide repeat protein [Alphaproteobacteria bacterium]MDP6590200.1 tetratricopeptide repeat protein [Alphaproteobacteria bacterium]